MSVSEGKKATRQRVIMTELALSPSVRTSELAMQLGVSAETVRRDIEELTRRGLVSRTYGGRRASSSGFSLDFRIVTQPPSRSAMPSPVWPFGW